MSKTLVKIVTSIPLRREWLQEVTELMPNIHFEITAVEDFEMAVWRRPTNNQNYGVFESVRQIINMPAVTGVRVRALIMSKAELQAHGITNHLALYDNLDRDGILDFYAGLPTRLDARARKNGFRSNFAWLFIHEILHGKEQERGREFMAVNNGDRVHDWEAEGRLKDLLREHTQELPEQDKRLGLMQTLLQLKQKLLGLQQQAQPTTTLLHPVPEPFRRRITQPYGVASKRYPLTGHHIGTDYGTPIGTRLVAPYNGEITATGSTRAMGNFCHFRYTFRGKTFTMRLAHLNEVPTRGGYQRGEVIAVSGNTGVSTGAHTHIDVWYNEVNLRTVSRANFRELTIDPEIHYY